MFEIKQYNSNYKNEWDSFIDNSKNGTFLFKRDYMNYHSDRFQDFSLLIYYKEKLYTLLPGNVDKNTFYSHQGLTYGGFIMSKKTTTLEMIDIVNLVNNFLASKNIKKVIYKAVPYIYHAIPAQEDIYALFKCCELKIIGRNLSSTIYQNEKIKFTESRKSGIRKALKNELIIDEDKDYTSFWKILNDNLEAKYNTNAVHSLNEIKYLAERFNDNIKLYTIKNEKEIIGGTVLYISNNVVHTQYISTSDLGKSVGALDLLFDHLINNIYVDFPIFDFGSSTEKMGTVLNQSLLFQKEGFGGRGVVYDIYEYGI